MGRIPKWCAVLIPFDWEASGFLPEVSRGPESEARWQPLDPGLSSSFIFLANSMLCILTPGEYPLYRGIPPLPETQRSIEPMMLQRAGQQAQYTILTELLNPLACLKSMLSIGC